MQKLVFLFVVSLSANASFGQVQLGLFGGIANYQGDLVDKPYQQPGAAFGLTAGYQLSNRITIRAGFTSGRIAGADSLNKKDLRLRNLSFQTSVSEFSLVGEFNTLDLSYKKWSPFVFAGIAVFHFDPYTFDLRGNKVFLRPLSTEGQGFVNYPNKPYSLTQFAIPFGGGIKYKISDRFGAALEVGLRKLFTDYLDDVSGNYADPNEIFANKGQQAVDLSYRGDEVPGGNLNYPLKGDQRGSPKYKDFYYFSGFHLTYLLASKNGDEGGYSRGSGKRKNNYGCPTVF